MIREILGMDNGEEEEEGREENMKVEGGETN